MKYLTTLEVAQRLKVSKQTLLNWLYSGKVPEPPRNPKGYRLWSEARLELVRRLIDDGRLHKRTIVHQQPSSRPEVLAAFAREVRQFLDDAGVPLARFMGALRKARPAGRRRTRSQGSSPAARRSGARPARR